MNTRGHTIRLLSGLAAFLLLGFGYGAAQTTIPDTPAGQAFRGWLAAFDSADYGRYEAFVHANWPGGMKRLVRSHAFRQMTGGFDLRKVEPSSTPTKFVALVQERNSDQFARLTLDLETADPHRISDVTLRAIARPAEFPLAHMSAADLFASLRTKLQQDTAADRFSGAVLVAKDGKPAFAQAYGLADREHKTPNTLHTRFRIGSMNKMFTAVATLQLVQAGKLRLDDPLGKYLTNYPNKDVAKVTIRQLLTHTGGTGDIFGPKFDAHRLELRTLDDYVKLYGKRAPKFQPGSRWAYSNYGFLLLGVVIARASGENYYDYVRKHVYAPARMTLTGSEPENRMVAGRSVGYMHSASSLTPNTYTLPYRGTSAGGGYSTVEDLFRFANALQRNTLLNARYTQVLTAGKVDIPGQGRRYAYGFIDQTMNGNRCFGHDGGAPGMSGDLEICPGNHYIVAVLANRDPAVADEVSAFITNRLPER